MWSILGGNQTSGFGAHGSVGSLAGLASKHDWARSVLQRFLVAGLLAFSVLAAPTLASAAQESGPAIASAAKVVPAGVVGDDSLPEVSSPEVSLPEVSSPEVSLTEVIARLSGNDAAAAGLAVFTAADQRQSGFGDFEVDLRMLLRSRSGASVERELELAQMEIADAGDRLLVVFQTPKAIRGTALLSHGQLQREDDQWLYLPALKRVKKIASRNRSGPFLGSEFSYEDLSSQEVSKYRYTYLREEPCGELSCYVVERRPGESIYSGYLRQVFWIDTLELRTWQVEYYNRGDRLLKTLTAKNFQLHNERYWRADTLVMQNHVSGKSTELHWQNFRYGVGLVAERDFSTTSLRRVR